MVDVKKGLQQELGPALKVVEPVSRLTTLGVGGPADYLFEARSSDDLVRAFVTARSIKIPLQLLGAGSSVVFSDAGYKGLVVKNNFEGITEIPTERAGQVIVEVGSGTSLAKLVRFTAEKGYTGLERFVGVTASVGGAVAYNIGPRDETLGHSVEKVTVIDITGRNRQLLGSNCNFTLGSSRFRGREEIILSVQFMLATADPQLVQNKLRFFLEQLRQPQGVQAIQMFEEGKEDPARLIAALGLASYKVGGIAVVDDSPNFMTNLGHGTSENVLELIRSLHRQVKEKYYTSLRPAFLYVGS